MGDIARQRNRSSAYRSSGHIGRRGIGRRRAGKSTRSIRTYWWVTLFTKVSPNRTRPRQVTRAAYTHRVPRQQEAIPIAARPMTIRAWQ